MRIKISYEKTAQENANEYYEKAKKVKKKIEGAKAALEKLRNVKVKREEERIRTVWRKEWYESFYWSFTSMGKLIIGGRNAQQNEGLNSRFFSNEDLFFHANVFGASFVLLKQGVSAEIEERNEAAQFAACYSKAWEDGLASVDVFSAKREQVTKSTQYGYLSKGGFLIKGEREWYKGIELKLVVYLNEEKKPMFMPGLTAKRKGISGIELKPGKIKKSDAAKFIGKKIGITDIDYLVQHMPPGEFSIS
ncbi:MAG: NFACT RNA binding domain-containing protein [Candidatus Micrarchaeaceae archaeon]